ncbi:MAG: DUF86 domain-containing protein [Prevotellaceae bacterium]|jgi:uncharacterized protein with HEPN domain|nr:DUF86 domain-containing protein [Prevotellaceae bacterium]
MSERNAGILLNDIIESGEKILHYVQGLSYEQFLDDDKTIDAVIRNFEIIGEAANRLPDGFKESHQEIDWYRIRGFRNRIVHHYFGIDYSILWQIKETFLPEMLSAIKQFI